MGAEPSADLQRRETEPPFSSGPSTQHLGVVGGTVGRSICCCQTASKNPMKGVAIKEGVVAAAAAAAA